MIKSLVDESGSCMLVFISVSLSAISLLLYKIFLETFYANRGSRLPLLDCLNHTSPGISLNHQNSIYINFINCVFPRQSGG